MSDADHDANPVDGAIEFLVFAPLGFALEARTLLPRFVERGRNQVALARVVGKFAVRKGREDIDAALLAGQAQLTEVLRTAGLVPAVPQRRVAPTAAERAGDVADQGKAATATKRPAPKVSTGNESGIEPAELAIPGYDSLAASQVVPRLDSLEADELEHIRRYEQGTRGRRTILSKITQIQAG